MPKSLNELIEYNLTNLSVEKCQHCHASGYILKGLENGFLKSDIPEQKLISILLCHKYWVKKVDDGTINSNYFEIGPYIEP